MNREQKIKAVENIILKDIDKDVELSCFYEWITKVSEAIVDSMEIDRGNFILSCVEKEIKASMASKILLVLTTDIIKIKE